MTIRRRDFVKGMAAGAAGLGALRSGASTAAAAESEEAKRFLLSERGCGRATAYAETNKIITIGDKTHVAWLDSEGKKFFVRVRTLDRKTGTWAKTVTVGEAYDNHGGPALTVDSSGYLHIVYYPHHHPFRYRYAKIPNDAGRWGDEIRFGTRCTYPTLMTGADDTLYVTCRESNKKNRPWVVNLYVKPRGGDWHGPTAILRSDRAGYSHFQEALAWGTDHRTLHLSTRMYSGGHAHTIGYMRSPDCGKTWEDAEGKRIELPATRETVTVLAHDRDKKLPGLRCGSVAVDPDGRPWVLYSAAGLKPAEAWIALLDAKGKWIYRPLLPHIQKDLPEWCGFMPGGMTFGQDGKLYVTLTAVPIELAKKDDSSWGHEKNEILRLVSSDGGQSFSGEIVSKVDPSQGHWMPSIERPTGHNRVTTPGMMYLDGERGDKNTDILSNKVWWAA